MRYTLFAVLGLVAVFIVAWVVDLACRPVVNVQGLKGALRLGYEETVSGNERTLLGVNPPPKGSHAVDGWTLQGN